MAQWAYAYTKPVHQANVKSAPADFQVTEVMGFEPNGCGEHAWLWVEKTHAHTERVAKEIARLANVAYRDVAYSGMKDVVGITRQWFSVWLAKKPEPDWSLLNNDQVRILRAERHTKKLRSGTHRANQFEIILRNIRCLADNLSNAEEGDALVEKRWQKIVSDGVPNYFGPQRFGRNGNNLTQALQLFSGHRVKNRSLNGILLSSARSFLFNHCLSGRVSADDWLNLNIGEPALLDGSESYFHAMHAPDEQSRISAGDVHPSTVLWGKIRLDDVEKYPDLHAAELTRSADYPELQIGLENTGMKAARRANRCLPKFASLNWCGGDLHLGFTLAKGQYATAVLRELVITESVFRS